MSDAKIIDLTPTGAQTPEGCARINKAMDALSASTAVCAQELMNLIQTLEDGCFGLQAVLTDGQYTKAESKEIVDDVERALKGWRTASEELVRSTCGAPPAP